jgi:hypothetical protein
LLDLPRQEKVKFAQLVHERGLRQLRAEFAAPGGLLKFVRHFWPVLEPATPFREGWALETLAYHVEEVGRGRLSRLLVNISPGGAKSLITAVIFPVWCWSALGQPSKRFLSLSYSSGLPERDNRRSLLLINSPEFQRIYGHLFTLTKAGEEVIETDKTGFKQAAGAVGTVTGRRADVIIADDLNNIAEDSNLVRENVARNFREAMSNRLNDLEKSAIIVIQQRSHENDVTGIILYDQLPYTHLCLPALSEQGRTCETYVDGELFWRDPRETEGECFFPERYPPSVIEQEMSKGPFYFNGQFQQRPQPRGGGILKVEYWQPYEEKEAPECDFILASLDPAFTAKQTGDASGYTIWGTFLTKDGMRGAILLYAARLRLEMTGPDIPMEPGERPEDYIRRTQHTFGLLETVEHTNAKFKVKHLVVEAKGPGLSIVQNFCNRLHRPRFTTSAYNPGRVDKIGRMNMVQPEFAAGMVYVPYRDGVPLGFAEMVIQECAAAEKGRQDDLCDSTTQALLWLRSQHMLEHRDEQFVRKEDAARDWQPKRALYNI